MHRNSSAIAVATLALRDTCLSCALPSVTTILIIYPSLQPAISIFAAATAAAAIELKNNVVSHSHLVRFLSLLHHSVHVAVWCAVFYRARKMAVCCTYSLEFIAIHIAHITQRIVYVFVYIYFVVYWRIHFRARTTEATEKSNLHIECPAIRTLSMSVLCSMWCTRCVCAIATQIALTANVKQMWRKKNKKSTTTATNYV